MTHYIQERRRRRAPGLKTKNYIAPPGSLSRAPPYGPVVSVFITLRPTPYNTPVALLLLSELPIRQKRKIQRESHLSTQLPKCYICPSFLLLNPFSVGGETKYIRTVKGYLFKVETPKNVLGKKKESNIIRNQHASMRVTRLLIRKGWPSCHNSLQPPPIFIAHFTFFGVTSIRKKGNFW